MNADKNFELSPIRFKRTERVLLKTSLAVGKKPFNIFSRANTEASSSTFTNETEERAGYCSMCVKRQATICRILSVPLVPPLVSEHDGSVRGSCFRYCM